MSVDLRASPASLSLGEDVRGHEGFRERRLEDAAHKERRRLCREPGQEGLPHRVGVSRLCDGTADLSYVP